MHPRGPPRTTPSFAEALHDRLQKSKIGITVNKLRKIEGHPQTSKLATDILIDWKKIMLESTVRKADTPARPESPHDDLHLQFKTGDVTRDKCIEMFVAALATDTPELAANPDELLLGTAHACEAALYAEFSGVIDPKYKAKFRSKYLNLKDRTNPQLRAALLQALISPAAFIAMTAAEMASEDRRRSDLALQEENLKNTKAAQDTSAETDQFKCGRCKQRKCKYYQLQTRSADEPMTTFVTCINCNNRWKFC